MTFGHKDNCAVLGGCGLTALATALVGMAAPAHAQSSAAAQETAGRDDIVVTARRTEEKLSDVPVSVTAIGAGTLEERRILSETDLQTATPGLTVRQTNSSNQLAFSLRGQSLDAFSFAAPAVLTYVNEFNAQGVAASSFYDLELIQVLKGPQGTLFGRNATGGAVLYQTQRPTDELGGYAKASYGNYDAHSLEGAINVPLGEFGAFRVASQYAKRDGYQHNVWLDTMNGSVDSFSIRPSLVLRLSDRLENYTMFQYLYTGGVSAGLKAQNTYMTGQMNGSTPLNFGLPSNDLYPDGIAPLLKDATRFAQLGFDGLPSFMEAQKSYGFYDIFNNQTGEHRARQYTVTNTTTFEVSDHMTIKNVVGYNKASSRDRTDVDGTPFEPLLIGFDHGVDAEGYTYRQKQFSDELQISGKMADDRLSYIAGLYYFSGTDYQRMQLAFAPDYTFCGGTCPDYAPTGVGAFLREYSIKSKSKAVYAQMTYALTDRLNLTAGGRWTWEKTSLTPVRRTAGYDGAVDDFNLGLPGFPATATLKANKPSWTLSLDYKVTDSLMVYASQRGSWRTGGFNGTAATALDGGLFTANSFKPETTYDFEVGAKFNGRLGDMPASFNLAVYDQHIKNVIRAIYLGVAAVSGNVPKARVTGVEFDGSIRPADWLQIGGMLTYTNARYTGNPAATVGNTTVLFGPYGDAPKWTGSGFFRATHEVPGLGEFALRGDIYAQSKFYYSNAQDTILPGTTIKGYKLIDARLELNNISDSGLSLTAYVKNLTKEKYEVGGFPLGAVFAINATLPGLPRMYGIEASFKF